MDKSVLYKDHPAGATDLEPTHGKQDNFFRDRSVVFSEKQLDSIKNNALFGGLYVSDIGYYPHAKNHFRRRKNGISEHILIYCIAGRGTVQLGGTKYHLQPNHFFIIPGMQPHAYWASEKSPWSIYWLHFGGERSVAFKEKFRKIIPIENTLNSRIGDRINLFNEMLTSLETGFSKNNIEYANLCLNSLLASFFYYDTYRSVKGHTSTDPVDQSILYMQRNIEQNLTISELSAHIQLSESHYSKLFRNKTGMSPMEYLINLKMQEAIRLLTNRSLRIKEVAFQLGYNDPCYFSRVFTRQVGVNPRLYIQTRKR